MLLTTWQPVRQLLAGIKGFALPALGLAGADLMTPRPVEAENTAPCLLDNLGPLVN